MTRLEEKSYLLNGCSVGLSTTFVMENYVHNTKYVHNMLVSDSQGTCTVFLLPHISGHGCHKLNISIAMLSLLPQL